MRYNRDFQLKDSMIFLVDVRYYKDFQLEMYGIPRHSLCSYVHVVANIQNLHTNGWARWLWLALGCGLSYT